MKARGLMKDDFHYYQEAYNEVGTIAGKTAGAFVMDSSLGGKMMQNKFFTLSYDDGITQDKRLVKIFNKYGIRATFNINSELLGNPDILTRGYVDQSQ